MIKRREQRTVLEDKKRQKKRSGKIREGRGEGEQLKDRTRDNEDKRR